MVQRHAPALRAGIAAIIVASACTAASGRAAGSTISVEAEDGGNALRGAAAVHICPSCSGGKLVRWIGYGGSLNMVASVPYTGPYTMQIAYTNGTARRSCFIRIDFNVPVRMQFAPTGGWKVVRTRTMRVSLTAGLNHIAFTNTVNWCPDVDRIALSR